MLDQRLVEMEYGASMASATFDDKIEEKKPTVQVGDPLRKSYYWKHV